ncbi:MAG: glycosyltransferase [Acidobacteria bacterium]|nr:glycosyltransferase [Acidobacteriota bacterium]
MLAGSWAGNAFAGLAALLLIAIAYAYAGYPLAARWLVRRREPALPPPGAELPRATVLVAARNEAGVIERRLRNLLDQDYPAGRLEVLVVSDASDDGTDEIVAGLGDPRVRLVRQPERRGKTAGINRIAPEARGEVLVQTDANVMFAPGAVAALARALLAPDAGVALGEVVFTNSDDPQVASGEGLYWRFETWTKRVEAERGLLAVANGGIYALRRELWRPLPAAIAGDAAEPLLAAREGFRTVIAPGALAYERAAATLREEYRRKARIIGQQVACARWIGLASLPGRVLWAYASHKLLRYAVPALAALAVAAGFAGAALGSRAGAVLGALPLAVLALAPLGLLRWPRALRLFGSALRIPLYLTVINVAAAAGAWRGLRGRAEASWDVPASTRERVPGA